MDKNEKWTQEADAPFLTIGIANYNYSRYLERALEQIKHQNFQNFEVLYCDDGSTDGSVEIIQKLIKENKNMNIRLISGKNIGIIGNKNRVLQNARGKYLMICDADDYMLEGCLEALCGAAIEADADCVIGGFGETDRTGHLLKRHIPSENTSKWLYTWHHAQIYKTEIVRKNGICFDRIPDDVFFLQKIHFFSEKTVFISQMLYLWERHSDSVSRDTVEHSDWAPEILWKEISDFIVKLKIQVTDKQEQVELTYYLYKWFYFNICDLSTDSGADLKKKIKMMQERMHEAIPNYKKLGKLRESLKVSDTVFARCAVSACWIMDILGIIWIAPMARTIQIKLRERRSLPENV